MEELDNIRELASRFRSRVGAREHDICHISFSMLATNSSWKVVEIRYRVWTPHCEGEGCLQPSSNDDALKMMTDLYHNWDRYLTRS